MAVYSASSSQNTLIFICFLSTYLSLHKKESLSTWFINYIMNQSSILISTYPSYGKIRVINDVNYYSYLIITKEEGAQSIEKFILESSIKYSNLGLKVLTVILFNHTVYRHYNTSNHIQKMLILLIKIKL
jgi:hypothetical protein